MSFPTGDQTKRSGVAGGSKTAQKYDTVLTASSRQGDTVPDEGALPDRDQLGVWDTSAARGLDDRVTEASAAKTIAKLSTVVALSAQLSGLRTQVTNLVEVLATVNEVGGARSPKLSRSAATGSGGAIPTIASVGGAFTEADGGKYDVKGEAGKTYSLLADQSLQVNAKLEQWNGRKDRTVVRDVGITMGSNQITVRGNGKVLINGEKLRTGVYLSGQVDVKPGCVTVRDDEYSIELKQSGQYVNDIYVTAENAHADGVMPHRLGQTDKDDPANLREAFSSVNLVEVNDLFDRAANGQRAVFDAADTRPGGFEAWINGGALEWATVSFDANLALGETLNDAQTPSQQGREQLKQLIDTLRAVRTVEPLSVRSVKQLKTALALVGQLLPAIHRADMSGQGDIKASLALMGKLKDSLAPLQAAADARIRDTGDMAIASGG